MSAPLLAPPREFLPCISIIGMPGAGKSTVAQALGRHLGWAVVDSDHIIEAVYGVPLQRVTDSMSKEAFLDVEAQVICSLRLNRTVIATGGSAVYREEAMEHLRGLGEVVYLHASLPLVTERIARKPDRGLAIGPGQSIADIYEERRELYTRYAAHTVHADGLTPQDCVNAIAALLRLSPA